MPVVVPPTNKVHVLSMPPIEVMAIAPSDIVFATNGEQTVFPAMEFTLASYTVPSGKKFYCLGFIAVCEGEAVFWLYRDGSKTIPAITVGANPNVFAISQTPLFYNNAGSVIELKVTLSNRMSSSAMAVGVIVGWLKSV